MEKRVYHIPNGPKNLATLFPSVDFSNLEEYYVEVADFCGTGNIATGTINQMFPRCDEDKVRLHFLNYLGTIDAMNFKLYVDEFEAKSQRMQKSLAYPLDKKAHAANRFNVQANNTLTLANVEYQEQDMKWIEELMASPIAWIEWTGIEGQDDSYLPVIILDAKGESKKLEDRYVYEVIVQVQMSNEKIIIRN